MSDVPIQLAYGSMSASFEDGTHIANNIFQMADDIEAGYNNMYHSGVSQGEAAQALLARGKQIANNIREGATQFKAQQQRGHEHMQGVQQIDANGAQALLG
jgi:hypothetical protein